MLDIKNLTVYNNATDSPLINGLSFTLLHGDRAAVIGEEGNGKSTLLKTIFNPELISGYCGYSGEVVTRGSRPGYLAQEPDSNEKNMRLCDMFARFGDQTALHAIFSQLHIDFELRGSVRTLGSLSGGESVRVRLACILADEPDFLLLDEPTNDIDIGTLEWLEKFINTSKIPVLFVSHDETLLENTANVIIHLELLRKKTMPRWTVERIGYADFIARRAASFAKQEQLARKEKFEYDKKMDKWRQIYQKVEHQQATITRQDPGGARLLKKKMKSVKSQHGRYEREAEDMTEMPDTEQAIFLSFGPETALRASKRVADISIPELRAGDRLLCSDVRLCVAGGEHICITGPNGCGKTTLMRSIYDSLKDRTDIKVGYMPQNYEDCLDYTKSALEFLCKTGSKDEMTRVRTYMGSVKFTRSEMIERTGSLSGGQKAKLFLLDMVLRGCDVLLLDEPTRNLSPMSNPVLREMLRQYRGTVICVTHDRKYVREVCDTLYLMSGQSLIKSDGQISVVGGDAFNSHAGI